MDQAEVEAARIAARAKQYTMFVEWAERLVERRAEANKFYISLNLAIVGAIGFLLTKDADGIANDWLRGFVMAAIAVAGAVVSANWAIVIASQRKVTRSKFDVIHKLEKVMPIQPYFDEWTNFAPNRPRVSIGAAEARLPIMFAVFYVILLLAMLPPLVISAAEGLAACGLDAGCVADKLAGLLQKS